MLHARLRTLGSVAAPIRPRRRGRTRSRLGPSASASGLLLRPVDPTWKPVRRSNLFVPQHQTDLPFPGQSLALTQIVPSQACTVGTHCLEPRPANSIHHGACGVPLGRSACSSHRDSVESRRCWPGCSAPRYDRAGRIRIQSASQRPSPPRRLACDWGASGQIRRPSAWHDGRASPRVGAFLPSAGQALPATSRTNSPSPVPARTRSLA